MLGALNEDRIEALLKELPVGRIDCHADGITYIVPINYVYDDMNLYAHSTKGMKIDMMRGNPEVCFQADAITNLQNWKSVVCWGKFEKTTNILERQHAMQKIISRVMPLIHARI